MRITAFSWTSPPRSIPMDAGAKSKSRGLMLVNCTSLSDNTAKSVKSPNPASSSFSRPCSTIAFSLPKFCKASATVAKSLGVNKPTTCPVGRKGFTNGPSKLKIVRTFKVRRNEATALSAGCQPGANKKVIPTSCSAACTFSLDALKFTPKASNTSALPVRLDAERLPCFATGIPDAAATNATAVEILKVDEPSPPVPQVSITVPSSKC
ncbi:hypothetical protein COO91_07145 [Nostoc flagelliforme CCNUN1]|uniref:Uncharacterized protein n=1 Tax=Nostoc flagelliforme CCNUN1 TaxID=2038116 RepID=A0A2K8T085_9NOSO|nr:hypothetical protein COO91_07145 [Nostoc flagelliforme CCNUN1]